MATFPRANARDLSLAIYRTTGTFPGDERFGLTSQIRRCAASIGANLAEGCGRGSDIDFARFAQISMGSASELEYHLLLCRDLGFLENEIHSDLECRTQRIKRMLASLLRALRKDQSPPANSR
ncbi:MAG: four helix bundle protein [Pirellulales bacterium]